jgi:hypothetical protein
MKLTFNYPSNWVNVPGVFTVCYREMAEPGEFPARVAISAKRLVHSPEGTVVSDELTEFVRVIRKQYDANTFQLGTPNTEDTFMGKTALSNTYLAYSGETEVKGFVIGQSVGRVLYVFHFSASNEGQRVRVDPNGNTSITLPAEVKEVFWTSFTNCPAVTHVTVPGTVTNILTRAFANFGSLQAVTIQEGVETIDPVGEPFDPLVHQAVGRVEDKDAFDETVAQVYLKGYRMGGKVIRAAMVTVTYGGPKRPVEEQEEA